MRKSNCILIFIVLLITFGCSDSSDINYPINPSFDPPIVNELKIYLENGDSAGTLRFGPVLVPPIDTTVVFDFNWELNSTVIAYPSISSNSINFKYAIEDDYLLSIFIVRANIPDYLGNQLYLGSNIGITSDVFTIYEKRYVGIGSHTFSMDLSSFNDGVYVIYLRNSTDGKIIGEAAFFKTNEANKQKIHKNLNLGVSK